MCVICLITACCSCLSVRQLSPHRDALSTILRCEGLSVDCSDGRSARPDRHTLSLFHLDQLTVSNWQNQPVHCEALSTSHYKVHWLLGKLSPISPARWSWDGSLHTAATGLCLVASWLRRSGAILRRRVFHGVEDEQWGAEHVCLKQQLTLLTFSNYIHVRGECRWGTLFIRFLCCSFIITNN